MVNAWDKHPDGQYFRDFANFGRPVKAASSLASFVARNDGHINTGNISKQPLQNVDTFAHPYWRLVGDCFGHMWSDMRYLPVVLMDQWRNDHPTFSQTIKRGAIIALLGVMMALSAVTFGAFVAVLAFVAH